MCLGKPGRAQLWGPFAFLWSISTVPSTRLALWYFCEAQAAENLLFLTILSPQCKQYFVVQRLRLSLQRELYRNARPVCVLLYPSIDRTRGDAGKRAKPYSRHIPVRLREKSTDFRCNETQRRTERCPPPFSCRSSPPYLVLRL